MDLAALWAKPIHVEPHAIERIRHRLGWDDLDRVVGEVRVALLEDRCSVEQPPWTEYPNATSGTAHKPGRFYAWDDSFVRCWVVAHAPGALFVVTVLLEWSHRADEHERRGLLRR